MGRRQTLDFNNKEFWSEEEKLNDEQLIHEFEEKVGHQFPNSFIQFTKEFHNGSTKKAEFYVNEDMSPEIRFMLSFNKETEYFNIWKGSYYGLTDFDPYVVIAQDIAGNLIALDYSKSETEPSVVFVDHELLGMIFLEEDREYSDEEIEAMETSVRLKDFPWAIFPVADSFLEFLNGLDGEVPYEPDVGEWYLDDEIEKVTIESIEYVENFLNKTFPINYKSMMLKYGGLRTNDNYVEDEDNCVMFSGFRAFDKTTPFYILKPIKNLSKEFFGDIVPFGYGDLMEYFAFDYSENKTEPKIIYIEIPHIYNCEDSIMDQYDNYIKLADNFEEFCNKMKYPPTLD